MTKDKYNLHEIDHRIRTIVTDLFDPDTGEVFGDLSHAADLLDQLGMDKRSKVLHCMKFKEEHDLLAGNLKTIEARNAKRRSWHEKKSKFLKAWVEGACRVDETFEDGEMAVSFRASTRIEIRDFDDVPKSLIIVKTTESVDKNAVKEWIKQHNGEVPSGIDQVNAKSVQLK